VLEREEGQHGPALRAFDRVQAARWWWCAFERDHPLDYGQYACAEMRLEDVRFRKQRSRTPETPECASATDGAG
jgi:hypothetical protein